MSNSSALPPSKSAIDPLLFAPQLETAADVGGAMTADGSDEGARQARHVLIRRMVAQGERSEAARGANEIPAGKRKRTEQIVK
jgi:hypothetical protein